MSDVFLSYAREDLASAQRLAELLERQGFSVSWDRKLIPGQDFSKVIRQEIRDAFRLIVLWSVDSVDAIYVKAEANEALNEGKILPVSLDNAEPPLPFGTLHTVDLTGWKRGTEHPGIRELLDALREAADPRMRQYLETALLNVEKFGDTDVLPFPVENHLFFDKKDQTLDLLQQLHRQFDEFLKLYPPHDERTLSVAGYYAYRWVTQIDPLWNAYLLALVVALGGNIERARVAVAEGIVFSYRFSPNPKTGALFDPDVGWRQYQLRSLRHAEEFERVLTCDVSDFYPRVLHERLADALKEISVSEMDREYVRRILALLKRLAKGAPYGLPVGGPAARLLSELLLNSVDRRLQTEGITFCRFADDYHLFSESPPETYRQLLFLSERLFEDQGFTLQKSKTRMMSTAEFRSTSRFADDSEGEERRDPDRLKLLNFKIKFDQYSENPEEQYEELREKLSKLDILDMLGRELTKSRVDPMLSRQLIRAVQFLDETNVNLAVKALLENVEVLYPLLPNVLQVVRKVIDRLDEETRMDVFNALRKLIQEGSYLLELPIHLVHAVRILAHDRSSATDRVLNSIFDRRSSMVRRDVVLAMARRGNIPWVDGQRFSFDQLDGWQKRALLIASARLPAGEKWRKELDDRLSPIDRLTAEWVSEKATEESWEVPI